MKKGLGDIIEDITTATGIKAVVEFLEEKLDFDCGCEERKARLNTMFPYQVECLTEEEYNFLKDFNFSKTSLDNRDQEILLRMFNRVFNQRNKQSSCTACWRAIIDNLKKLFDEYKKNK